MYKLFGKRIFDLFVSLVFIILLSPLFVILSILIYLFDGLPIFFNQERVGKNNIIFVIIKFRTLDNLGNEIKFIGKFLRKYKLDEIPNFLNVVLGDMSLVGPRPLKKDYLKHYSKIQIKRHNIKPGIFGITQSRENNKDWKKYFQMDLFYLKNFSFFFDICLIFISIFNIIFGKLRSKPLSEVEKFKNDN